MSDSEVPDDLIDIELRSPAAVAMRCLVVATMIRRFSADSAPLAEQRAVVFDLREWLRAEGLWDHATRDERDFLLRPPDSPLVSGGQNLGLLAESVATLAWALALSGPGSDASEPDVAGLLEDLPAPWDKTMAWISSKALRPESEIAFLRERTDIWRWRLELEPYRRVAAGRDLMDIERSIRDVTSDGVAAGLLLPGKKGGFSLDGVPLTRIDLAELDELQFAFEVRLLTLNWVCGFGNTWDSVPLDV